MSITALVCTSSTRTSRCAGNAWCANNPDLSAMISRFQWDMSLCSNFTQSSQLSLLRIHCQQYNYNNNNNSITISVNNNHNNFNLCDFRNAIQKDDNEISRSATTTIEVILYCYIYSYCSTEFIIIIIKNPFNWSTTLLRIVITTELIHCQLFKQKFIRSHFLFWVQHFGTRYLYRSPRLRLLQTLKYYVTIIDYIRNRK